MRDYSKNRYTNDIDYRETMKKRANSFYLKNKDVLAKKARDRYRVNQKEYATSDRLRYIKLRNVFFDILGYKCVLCGFNDRRALQLDHIHNNGNAERLRFNGTAGEHRYYSKHRDEIIDNFQILCANCNWIKEGNTDRSTYKSYL